MEKTPPPTLVYVLGAAWAAYLFWLGATGGLGAEPIRALEHAYGIAALNLLVLGLCISPLRRFAGVNLLRYRRAVGVTSFFFVLCHLVVWAVLDLQSPARLWADIVKRPYITVGMVAFILLLPLAATSNNRSVRWLGAKWRQMHRLTFVAVPLAGIHFIMGRKGLQSEPLIYMMGIAILLSLRLFPRTARIGTWFRAESRGESHL
nr:protein-methionine-sulfoxide reductase heme-binding subunit MsrQ [Thalassovita sp.]